MPPLDRACPLLDLHGYQREAAMAAVTRFLEVHARTGALVCIVTGTGSHSPNGPVLRSALISLLQRRQMEYEQDKPGSFRVRAGTGIVFYRQASTEPDTKLLIENDTDDGFSLRNAMSRSRATATPSRLELLVPPQGHMSGPTLSEVVASETAFSRAREESLDLQRQRTKEEKIRESQELQLAMEVSRRQLEVEEDELDDSLQKAIKSSELEALKREQEEAVMRRAMQESEKEQKKQLAPELTDEELQNALQEAMNLSLRDACSVQDEEEQMLQRVLEMSRQEG